MSQNILNSCQAHWFIQLAFHDFIIYYCKNKLNLADESSCCLNYMNENEIKASDIMIVRLMSIFLNKLCSDRLEFKELATATLEADEQISAADSVSFTENLIWALFLQVITQSAARQAISHKSVDSFESLSILDRDSVILDKDSDSILNKDSDSRSLCLSKSAFHSSADKTTDKFFKTQTQF